MRSFEVSSQTPSDFVRTVRNGLAARGHGDRVSIGLDDDVLTVDFSWMGTSSFEYRVAESGEGFRAELVRQHLSPVHAAFSHRFDEYFAEALAKVGARIV